MENRFNDSTMRAKLARRIAPALTLSLGLSLFAPVFGQQAPQVQVSEKTSEATDPAQAPAPSEISRTFVEAAKRIKPAVVHRRFPRGEILQRFQVMFHRFCSGNCKIRRQNVDRFIRQNPVLTNLFSGTFCQPLRCRCGSSL